MSPIKLRNEHQLKYVQGIASTEGDQLNGKGGENLVKNLTSELDTTKEASEYSLTQDYHPSTIETVPIPIFEDGIGIGCGEGFPLNVGGYENPIYMIKMIPLERSNGTDSILKTLMPNSVS